MNSENRTIKSWRHDKQADHLDQEKLLFHELSFKDYDLWVKRYFSTNHVTLVEEIESGYCLLLKDLENEDSLKNEDSLGIVDIRYFLENNVVDDKIC